jgi:Ser/Thr protein kinase RdoA (MazF antagonist)
MWKPINPSNGLMSSSALYRNPTWISLFPRTPDAVPAPRAAVERLSPHLPGPGTLRRLDYEGRPGTHYVFEPACGEKLFLKLVADGSAERQAEADAVAAWLAERGVSCVGPAAGFPRRLDDATWLFGYPYRDCEPLEPNPSNVARLGRELAKLHRALAGYPARRAWEAATDRRLAHLVEVRRAWARGELRLGPRPAALTELARDESLDFVRADLEATPLHGDLNAGNLRRLVDGRPLLLDFEDTFHSVLPCVFELGLVFERIVLVAVEDDRRAAGMLWGLVESYRRAGGVLPAEGSEAGEIDWPRILRSLALRSLCVITSCELAGVAIDAGEWHKFFKLAAAAANRPNAFCATARTAGALKAA